MSDAGTTVSKTPSPAITRGGYALPSELDAALLALVRVLGAIATTQKGPRTGGRRGV